MQSQLLRNSGLAPWIQVSPTPLHQYQSTTTLPPVHQSPQTMPRQIPPSLLRRPRQLPRSSEKNVKGRTGIKNPRSHARSRGSSSPQTMRRIARALRQTPTLLTAATETTTTTRLSQSLTTRGGAAPGGQRLLPLSHKAPLHLSKKLTVSKILSSRLPHVFRPLVQTSPRSNKHPPLLLSLPPRLRLLSALVNRRLTSPSILLLAWMTPGRTGLSRRTNT